MRGGGNAAAGRATRRGGRVAQTVGPQAGGPDVALGAHSKRIEQGFGWAKFMAPIRQGTVRGTQKVDQLFTMAMVAYKLVRMRALGQVRLEVM